MLLIPIVGYLNLNGGISGMLYTDVYTAARLMNVTTSCVYKRIHHAGGWWAEGLIRTGKKCLLPLSKVAHMTERAESDLAEEIKRTPRLCLLDVSKREVQRLRSASVKSRKRKFRLHEIPG